MPRQYCIPPLGDNGELLVVYISRHIHSADCATPVSLGVVGHRRITVLTVLKLLLLGLFKPVKTFNKFKFSRQCARSAPRISIALAACLVLVLYSTEDSHHPWIRGIFLNWIFVTFLHSNFSLVLIIVNVILNK